MAYYQDLQRACMASGCRKWAVREVFNNKRRSLGKFCKEDARRAIERENRREKEEKDAIQSRR